MIKGAWLSNFAIEYFSASGNIDNKTHNISHVSLNLDGYIYSPDPNDQIRQLNNMVQKMKDDKDFSEHFDNIILIDSRSEIFNNYSTKNFRINCK